MKTREVTLSASNPVTRFEAQMQKPVSEFVSAKIVAAKLPMSKETRKRLEDAGRHPKRIQVSDRLSYYRTAEWDEYEADPEAWVSRRTARAEAANA